MNLIHLKYTLHQTFSLGIYVHSIQIYSVEGYVVFF